MGNYPLGPQTHLVLAVAATASCAVIVGPGRIDRVAGYRPQHLSTDVPMMTDPNNPEVLIAVPTDVEATAIVTALAERGVQASTTGGFTAGFRAEAPGQVSVIVRHSDLAQAKHELAEIKIEIAEIDWSKVDVGQPEDGE